VRLLVTRPEPDCERTAALLRERGHEVLLLPLLRIEPVADAELGSGPWAAVLLTSANAVRAIAGHRRFGELAGLPVYAVGQRTRTGAAAAGFVSIVSADGDVEALVRLIASKPPAADVPASPIISYRDGAANSSLPASGGGAAGRHLLPLLYCAGEDRASDLAGGLRSHGLHVETVIVYRSVMVTDLTPGARAALAGGAVDAVLHYSARTAAAFVAAVTTAGVRDLSIRARHLCLSAQVAGPLAAAGAKTVEVASEPNEQALLALVDRA
jgi:uroporphyrinogen-III synthase